MLANFFQVLRYLAITVEKTLTTVESKKSLKKIANFGKVKNAIFSKKMLKIES